jgi:hypothetical protein
MTHRDVMPLLSDLLTNQIGEPDATAAWTHVASCIECRQAVTAMHEVRAAVARGGVHLFEAHPTSQEIVLFALNDPTLSDDERNTIEAHIAECPTCSDEVLLTRRAESATRSGPGGPISVPGGLVAWLAPALAAVIVMLAFPAFVGLVRYPGLVREHQRVGSEIEGLRAEQSETLKEQTARDPLALGGAVRVLFLPATTRGAESIPVVEQLPGQAWQPVIIQHRPFADATPSGHASVEVTREPSGTVVWRERVAIVQAWDSALGAVTLMIPTAGLDPGVFRIALSGEGIVGYESRFEVRIRGR